MGKIVKTVKIVNSPFTSNLEVVDSFVMKLHVPYSDSSVTIQINPNITHYEEKPENINPKIDIRQVTTYQNTEDTLNLLFDFKENNSKQITISDKSFDIKLLSIGKVDMQGQNFPEFEFLVTEK